ncbi:MAG: DUF86 domain-containing protein [Dissulfuribacterales bacterium]
MSKRNERLYLTDILDLIIGIEAYIQNMTVDEFANDRKTYNATIREFEIIGEAVKQLSDQSIEKYPHIQWRDIIDFRNLLIHEYFGVDLDMVWNIIIDDLPGLKSAVEELLDETDDRYLKQ